MAAPTKPTRASGKTPSRSEAPKSTKLLTAGSPTSTSQLSAFTGIRRVPAPINEPIRSYAPGSPERTDLKARLDSMAGEQLDIPVIIAGKEIRTGDTSRAVMPH